MHRATDPAPLPVLAALALALLSVLPSLALGAAATTATETTTTATGDSSSSSSDASGGSGRFLEVYDSPPYRHTFFTQRWTTGMCPISVSQMPDWTALQLSTPPTYPWRYTRITFMSGLDRTDSPDPVTAVGTVVMNDIDIKDSDQSLSVGSRLATHAVTWQSWPVNKTYNEIPWVSIDLTPFNMVVMKKAAWVGVSYRGCATIGLGCSSQKTTHGRLGWAQDRVGLRRWTGETGQRLYYDALAIRIEGEPYIGPHLLPQGWACAPEMYNDGSTCDCACGDWDPDCALDPHSDRCPDNTSYICTQGGWCADPGWNDTCDRRNYFNFDGCDCGCGGFADPDCLDPWNTVNSWTCPGYVSPTCSMRPLPWSPLCVDHWQCDASQFNDGKMCNCECGSEVLDPDCSNRSLPSTCDPQGMVCYNGKCSVPRNWTCALADYGGTNCECGCGAWDTGCSLRDGTSTCRTDQFCSPDNFTCIFIGCGNGYKEYSELEECDGGFACFHNCTCMPGYVQIGGEYRRNWCDPICGDGRLVAPEECEKGNAFCLANCTCMPGHRRYTNSSNLFCAGCGNFFLDDNESCDGGLGCTSCNCTGNYTMTSPPSIHCVPIQQPASVIEISGSTQTVENTRVALIAGTSVGGGAAVLLVAGALLAGLYIRKVRKGPRAFNSPIELDVGSRASFVPASEDALTIDPTAPVAAPEYGLDSMPSPVPNSMDVPVFTLKIDSQHMPSPAMDSPPSLCVPSLSLGNVEIETAHPSDSRDVLSGSSQGAPAQARPSIFPATALNDTVVATDGSSSISLSSTDRAAQVSSIPSFYGIVSMTHESAGQATKST
eukprot:m51a1_g7375 hypothetical protein (829) ;mRNA; f:77291-80631